ncbi:Y-family DNA polymerase [Endozoicomonas gorgoniicola]|uniref:Y-family DNA polymerase n=1 Tax=Endozoicomonas gorgoniicola TaxID=1234144 RepID=A0ABT3MV64_9GAMM|nr:Y-family DNA polymerase [Endozoicomonas gorgoniicola]MCW7552869.1 Y-family DNA polymerase [Endozoicomonas gorgoniicola]
MGSDKVIALCDANSFYCACERVFDPTLLNIPLGVLSNNDGCIVARTPELKALGVKMGTPAFKVRHLVEQGAIVLKSSNYTLYGDMSSRFMWVLEQFSPDVEVYSIDEAFVDLAGFPKEQLLMMGQEIKQRVQQWTGLPIGVGISTTKTLAKLANYAAKKYRATGGVVDLTDSKRQQRLMAITPVGEVWGVGRKISQRLQRQGIHTAADLVKCQRSWIKKHYSVVLERTVCELQGESCIPREDENTGNKHQIICSRSFGGRVTEKSDLHSALSSFATRACEKLRSQQKFAREAVVFIRTDPFKEAPQYCQSIRLVAPSPTNDTRLWLQQITPALDALYQQGYEYKKAGFMLLDLCGSQSFQGDLLSMNSLPEASEMMKVLDAVNQRFGQQTLKPASIGFQPAGWCMSQQSLSPKYTTRWSDIMTVGAR